MFRKTTILIDNSLFSIVQYGLQIVQEYDPLLKQRRSKWEIQFLEPNELIEQPSRWEPVKDDLKDMSLRHFHTTKSYVTTSRPYEFLNEKLAFEARLDTLYTYLLHSYKYLNENSWIAVVNTTRLVYDVSSKNLIIVGDQIKNSAIFRFLQEQSSHITFLIGKGWVRVCCKFEDAESSKIISDLASWIVTHYKEFPEGKFAIKWLYRWAIDFMRREISETDASEDT